jgi:AraC family transcriptional regulator
MQVTGAASPELGPEDWMKLMPRSPGMSSAALGWSGIQAYRLANPPSWQLQLPPINRHFIVAHLCNPCELSTRWNGVERRSRSVPGNIMIMSAHQGSYWAWKGEIEELHIFLDPQILSAAAAELGDQPVRLLDGIGILDRPLMEIALRINAELAQPGICGRLFGESMTQALALQLLRCHSTLGQRDALERLDIPAHRMRAALEYIEACLCEDLSLEAIAAAAHLSTFRFARGFRKALGQPPHQYIIARRLERAKDLLRTTDEAIGEVARRVGFASQSHFTAVFSKRCGLPPKRYRRSCRNRS